MVVSRYLSAAGMHAGVPRDDDAPKIHVILGDMHIPVLDEVWQTEHPPVSPSDAWRAPLPTNGSILADLRKDGDVVEAGYDAAVVAAGIAPDDLPTKEGDRVRRWGRVDIGPIECFMQQLVPDPSSTNQADALLPVVKFFKGAWDREKGDSEGLAEAFMLGVMNYGEKIEFALNTFGITLNNWKSAQDVAGVIEDTMTLEDANKWFEYYVEGVGGPPANIFEHAGDDLVLFVDGLNDYRKQNPSCLPLQFHQLGDMLDFWIGFTSHYVPSGSYQPSGMHTVDNASIFPVDPARSPQDPPLSQYGIDLVNHWTNNCLSITQQGRRVASAIEGVKSFEPHFCYGNHDNYLGGGGGLSPEYLGPSGKTHLMPRKAFFHEENLFMEHGHQWHAANADNAPILPGSGLLLGTNSPFGQFVTQAAFIRPQPIRNFEGSAAALVSDLSGQDYGQRLTQMAYAADKFAKTNSFYCYVMGHTHSSVLCRVKLRRAERHAPADFRRQNIGAPRIVRPAMDLDGRVHAPVVTSHTSFQDFATVTVWYRGLPGDPGRDPQCSWISLDSVDAGRGVRRKGFWKWANDPEGSVVFANVPPGRYVARSYLEPHDKEPWGDSGAQNYGADVEGWALEAPPTDDAEDDGDQAPSAMQGSAYSFHTDRDGFSLPPVLLWNLGANAYNPHYPNFFLMLFRADDPHHSGEEAAHHLSAGTREGRMFAQVAPEHPAYGRFVFDAKLLGYLVQHVPTQTGHSRRFALRLYKDVSDSRGPADLERSRSALLRGHATERPGPQVNATLSHTGRVPSQGELSAALLQHAPQRARLREGREPRARASRAPPSRTRLLAAHRRRSARIHASPRGSCRGRSSAEEGVASLRRRPRAVVQALHCAGQVLE